jgi:hypothetical protein
MEMSILSLTINRYKLLSYLGVELNYCYLFQHKGDFLIVIRVLSLKSVSKTTKICERNAGSIVVWNLVIRTSTARRSHLIKTCSPWYFSIHNSSISGIYQMKVSNILSMRSNKCFAKLKNIEDNLAYFVSFIAFSIILINQIKYPNSNSNCQWQIKIKPFY